MVGNDSATDGEPEPRSLPGRFRGEEGLKEPVLDPLGDSRSVVCDLDSGRRWRVVEANVDPAAGFGNDVGGVL